MGMEIEGLEDLVSMLTMLGDDVIDDIETGMKQGVGAVAGIAKRLVSVDTGYLRESIHGTVKTFAFGGDPEVIGKVGTNVAYALPVEVGSGQKGELTYVPDKYPGKLHYRQGKWRIMIPQPDGKPLFRYTSGQPARPFLYPAFVQGKKIVPQRLKAYLQKRIREKVRGNG